MFCVPNVVNLYELRMSIKHFSVDSIKFEFGSKEKFTLNDFLCQAIFEIFQI